MIVVMFMLSMLIWYTCIHVRSLNQGFDLDGVAGVIKPVYHIRLIISSYELVEERIKLQLVLAMIVMNLQISKNPVSLTNSGNIKDMRPC